jgi:predicted alpha/beta superfamily hydrolase
MMRFIRFVWVLGVWLSLSSAAAGQYIDADPDADIAAERDGDADSVMLHFVVAVPVDTPIGEPVYLSGDDIQLGNWDGKGLRLEDSGKGGFIGSLTLRRDQVVQFKATRGSWLTVEKNGAGGDVDNRLFVADHDKLVKIVVAAWASGETALIEPTLTGDIRRHDAFHSTILNNDRTLLVYVPQGYEDQADRRYPVLYMHDGQNIFDASTSFAGHEWEVDEAAERLIAGGDIEPIIIVGIYNNADRMTEYTPRPEDGKHDAYARFVVEEVKPFIDRTYRTNPSREKTGIAGSSLGGLISLYMAEAYPDTFGMCAGVSPSLWWGDGQLLKRWQSRGTDWMHGTRFWLDIGTAEGRVAPGESLPSSVTNARLLAELFGKAGLKPGEGYAYLEVEGGKHNEQAWAKRIDAILLYLYGTP